MIRTIGLAVVAAGCIIGSGYDANAQAGPRGGGVEAATRVGGGGGMGAGVRGGGAGAPRAAVGGGGPRGGFAGGGANFSQRRGPVGGGGGAYVQNNQRPGVEVARRVGGGYDEDRGGWRGGRGGGYGYGWAAPAVGFGLGYGLASGPYYGSDYPDDYVYDGGPGYGYEEESVPVATGGAGNYCATPQKTCQLFDPAPIGVGCSCKAPGGGSYRGTVTP